MSLIVDLGRALAQIGDPRFRAVLWKSLGLTLLALALVFWATMLALGWLLPDTVTLPWIGEVGFVDDPRLLGRGRADAACSRWC